MKSEIQEYKSKSAKKNNDDYQNKSRESLKKGEEYKNQRLVSVCGVILCAFMILLAGLLGERQFEVTDYIYLEFLGTNGYASAECVVDSERIYEVFSGNEKDAEKLADYKKLAESITAAVGQKDISNSDRLEVVIDYDKELAQKTGVNIKKTIYTVRASGIGDGVEIDLFDDIAVTFMGISPDANVVIENNHQDEYLSKLEYTADKSSGIVKGDNVTITCNVSAEDLARHGYTAKTFCEVYAADRLSSYVTAVSQLDGKVLDVIQDEIKDTINKETQDKTFRMLYKATSNQNYLYALNDEEATNIELSDALLLTRKGTDDSNAGNYLYYIYSAAISNGVNGEIIYFAFEYSQGYVTADGGFNILHSEPNKRYVCTNNYEELYAEQIEAKAELYNIQKIE